jgi:hypothetical protein
MTLVRLVGDYILELDRLSPGGDGYWGNVQFTNDPVPEADFLISLNYPKESLEVVCPKEHCWALIQEPPTNMHHHLHTSHWAFSKVFSCQEKLQGHHRVLTHPNLSWYVGRGLDQLETDPAPRKTADLSTVTSNLTWLSGHKQRFQFLRDLRESVEFDWFGRGVLKLADKWDGLAPYRYSLAFENYRSGYYWTEKIADCYLAETMPIYYGCPRITEYFPAESMVRIDINHPDEARKVILKTIESDRYEKSLDAIRAAKARVLRHYNPLAFLAGEIEKHMDQGCRCQSKQRHIKGRPPPITVIGRTGFLLKFHLERLLRHPVWLPVLS